ncbi:DNA-(apurinic or apyrimidinic site) lyase isoform X1 [Stegastes partitus]|uniref:DNA-(apurinic or apyrimidinic site) lyase-like n=1 Tax=Stegastes partitus TaxID=144197 RepID=A0A3B4ZB10_9TELE|nr:PREDICTED: DNA-(apurinic or apyrimidinic site) lyase-like isoform X1 [Stegastes partitus]XP_008294993.1 PREDICTED: DNA-(apurinic or apyrimidinic site) lyase-like isoform X1 [Stegastes partitus]
MGPRKIRKRKNEDSLGGEKVEKDTEENEAEERRDRRRKDHGNKYIGAQVGIQGGIWKAVESCMEIGGNCFALFLGSQRSWKRPALDQTAAAKFREQCSLQGFDPAHILPHGSYLMNCGSPKEDVFEKSQALLVDELNRCSLLGLNLYNFHPGSSLGTITTQQCVEKIAGAINHAHQQTPTVVTVLENMSGQGNTVGGKFAELKSIIDKVRDQTRVGVCLDTCHAFAAGYDLAAEGGVKAMLDEFDQEVGLHYLRALHLNDSKGKLGCNLDRHEDIGKGHIGVSAFRDIVNEPRLDNIPMILETPGRTGFKDAEQIELLYSLCKN